jgi:pimeloyl-ACP methyl ester carboxylesterase
MPQKTFEADTGAGLLAGWEAGEGPPLLLLHGGPGLSDYMSLLGAETAGWRSIGYQQRGIPPSALLPDAEVVVGPGAGHLPWHERPGCVASALSAVRDRAGI